MRKRIPIIVTLAGAALMLSACGGEIGEADAVPSLVTRATTPSATVSTSGTVDKTEPADSTASGSSSDKTTTTTKASEKTTTATTTTSATTTELSFTPVSGMTVYAVERTELNFEPDTNSSIIWYIEPKDMMSVISVSSDKAWYRVTHNGAEGYVAVKMTTETAPVTTTTTTTATTTTATTTTTPPATTAAFTPVSGKTVYAVDYAALRTDPAPSSAIIWYIDPGAAISVTAVSADGAWYRVTHNGVEGYVAVGNTTDTAPAAATTSETATAAAEVPEPEETS